MKPVIVIKIGGRSLEKEEALTSLLSEICGLDDDYSFVLVHGGGAVVSGIQKKYDIEPVFENGLRMTSSGEMDIVDMGLAGKVNTSLVRKCRMAGLDAVGLSGSDGGLFSGVSLGKYKGAKNHSGKVSLVDVRLLQLLLDNGYFPVVNSVSMDIEGDGININADEAAFPLASALQAQSLIFISDIPGVMINSKVIPCMNETAVEAAIKDGEISGGMIPKTLSSLIALKEGVNNVVIGDYLADGDLKKSIEFRKGTRIIK